MTPPLAVTLPLYVAGYSMLAHVALCFLLRRGLAGNRELESTLMAVPNGRFGSGFDFRLLRLRYSLPWAKVPMEVHSLKPWVRTILTMARVTGIIFPAGILALALGAVLSARA